MKLETLRTLFRGARRLLLDERGAEGLEKLLIIGAIVLPLLGVLYIFRDRIVSMLEDAWSGAQDQDSGTTPNLP